MRTTVTLDDDLLARATEMMGGLDRSTVLHEPTPGEDTIVSHSLVVVVAFVCHYFYHENYHRLGRANRRPQIASPGTQHQTGSDSRDSRR